MKFNNRPNRCIEVSGKTCWISRDVTVLGVIFFVIGETAYVPLGLRGDQMPTEPGKWGLPGGISITMKQLEKRWFEKYGKSWDSIFPIFRASIHFRGLRPALLCGVSTVTTAKCVLAISPDVFLGKYDSAAAVKTPSRR